MGVDWSESPDVEVIERKVSGKTLLRDSRIPVDMLIDNSESRVRHGMTYDEAFIDTIENYPGAGADRLKRILEYSHFHQLEHQL